MLIIITHSLPSIPLSFIHNKLHHNKKIKHRHNCWHVMCYIIQEEPSSFLQQKYMQSRLLHTVTRRQTAMCWDAVFCHSSKSIIGRAFDHSQPSLKLPSTSPLYPFPTINPQGLNDFLCQLPAIVSIRNLSSCLCVASGDTLLGGSQHVWPLVPHPNLITVNPRNTFRPSPASANLHGFSKHYIDIYPKQLTQSPRLAYHNQKNTSLTHESAS